ncbi:MAG: hypothetical protein M1833_001159 [Piccolia ochrophora]|nr:MAG: hypothetical protein M1833_001159 [Piccolia ochrophora]
MASDSFPDQTIQNDKPPLSESQRDSSMATRFVNAPEPNPHFVFPARSTVEDGGLSTPNGMTSPPASPTSTQSTSARIAGHRRRGSEFIGGDGKEGRDLGLMSSSPTKPDGGLPLPSPSIAFGRPSGRRGHAHRRSGAISCHDLTMILKPQDPAATPRAGSAPTTPAEIDPRRPFIAEDFVQGRVSTESSDTAANTRTRVGFSDILEFIPRPLSTLSSETSSSLNTVRGNHSVSGSLSSITSLSTWSPSKDGRRGSVTNIESESPRARPKTASAGVRTSSLDRGSSEGGVPPTQRPHSARSSAPPSEVLSNGRFGVDDQEPSAETLLGETANQNSTNPTAPNELSRTNHLQSPPPTPIKTEVASTISSKATTNLDKLPSKLDRKAERKADRKQRRVKHWAGSILSRKTRQRGQKQRNVRRTPTPPLRLSPPPVPVLPGSAGAVDSCIAPTNPTCGQVFPQLTIKPTEWVPRQLTKVLDSDAMSPMIDLDAALGPFNTPNLGLEPSDRTNGGFTSARRRMHSSGMMSGFAGPGMHYHRRTESAPEMAAFEFGHFGLHRLGSSSTMADVFEEDEDEDEVEIETDKSTQIGKVSNMDNESNEQRGMGIKVVDNEEYRMASLSNWSFDDKAYSRRRFKRRGSDVGEGERQKLVSTTDVIPLSSLSAESCTIDKSDVITDINDGEASDASITKSSDATITPPIATESAARKPAPIDIGSPVFTRPLLSPDSSSVLTTPSFPSPELPMHAFEFSHAETAASSFTDEQTLDSLLMGEPGPELRMSVDDVPSLTSSNSTMTSGVGYHIGPLPPSRGSRGQEDRSSSFSSDMANKSTQSLSAIGSGKRSSLSEGLTGPEVNCLLKNELNQKALKDHRRRGEAND